MNWQQVALATVAPTPWRNGGGLTSVLAQWPAEGDWRWRMSVAIVDRSGPFSNFDGVDRWFAVLDGAGVILRVAGQTYSLATHSAPLAFDGAAETACELVGGRTIDFNLMVKQAREHTALPRAGMAQSRMQRVRGVLETRPDSQRTLALYANQSAAIHWNGGLLRLPAQTLVFTEPGLSVEQSLPSHLYSELGAPASLRIESADALWMEIPE